VLDGAAVDGHREASEQLDPDHDAGLQAFGKVGVNTRPQFRDAGEAP
jgi:hypothetical protein